MLEKFRQAKEPEIERLRRQAERGELPPPWQLPRPSFKKALSGDDMAVIAEYKRASPSRGEIRKDLPVGECVTQYQQGGAAALSILTEERFFDGQLDYIKCASHTGLPILRKDFIFDPLQIRETASTPASSLLLIARCLPSAERLRQMREEAEKFGLECVVEVFDKKDLLIARESGTTLIQVNARDLARLHVNQEGCLELISENPPLKGEIWIAASGIDSPEQLVRTKEAGYRAALVGTALMLAPSPGSALASLIRGATNAH